jgi:hypothetical protein
VSNSTLFDLDPALNDRKFYWQNSTLNDRLRCNCIDRFTALSQVGWMIAPLPTFHANCPVRSSWRRMPSDSQGRAQ